MSAVLTPSIATRSSLPRALLREHGLLLAIVALQLAAALAVCAGHPQKFRDNLQDFVREVDKAIARSRPPGPKRT